MFNDVSYRLERSPGRSPKLSSKWCHLNLCEDYKILLDPFVALTEVYQSSKLQAKMSKNIQLRRVERFCPSPHFSEKTPSIRRRFWTFNDVSYRLERSPGRSPKLPSKWCHLNLCEDYKIL